MARPFNTADITVVISAHDELNRQLFDVVKSAQHLKKKKQSFPMACCALCVGIRNGA